MRLRIVDQNDSKHFRDRLFQRFGILLTASDMWDLRDKMAKAKKLSSPTQWPPHYLLTLEGKPVIILYDYIADRFVTAMAPGETLIMKTSD